MKNVRKCKEECKKEFNFRSIFIDLRRRQEERLYTRQPPYYSRPAASSLEIEPFPSLLCTVLSLQESVWVTQKQQQLVALLVLVTLLFLVSLLIIVVSGIPQGLALDVLH